MDRCSQNLPSLNPNSNRRLIRLTMPHLPILHFLFLISLFLSTTTVVVRATNVVNGEESADAIRKEIGTPIEIRRQGTFSYDLNEDEKIVMDRNINDINENQNTVGITNYFETPGNSEKKTSDHSLNKNMIEEFENVQKDHSKVDGGSIEESVTENLREGERISLQIKNNTKYLTNQQLKANGIEEIKHHGLWPSENELSDEEFQDGSVIEETSTLQKFIMEEEEAASIISPFTKNSRYAGSEETKRNIVMGDDIEVDERHLESEESPNSWSSVSSENTKKMQSESFEKKKDMKGKLYSLLEHDGNESTTRPSGSVTKNRKAEEARKNSMMENDTFVKLPRSQYIVGNVDGTEDGKEQENNTYYNTVTSIPQFNMRLESNTPDKNSQALSQEAPIFSTIDDHHQTTKDNSYIDLDLVSEGLNLLVVEEELGREKGEGDDVDFNENVTIKDENTEDFTSRVNMKAHARAQARNDLLGMKTANSATSEISTTVTTGGYSGEPWGQYRSTRRLPDLELLRLLFENTNKTEDNRGRGDTKSQKVVNDWREDPLYDENMIEGVTSQEQLPVDKMDQNFIEHRFRLLDQDHDGGTDDDNDTKPKTTDNSPTEELKDKKSNEINERGHHIDVNSEFIEGLDDIDNFFEGVDPPDELDVGYGSSIQDVLMDKGKHILIKKIRGVVGSIKIGWETMRRKVEERIVRFRHITDTVSDPAVKSLKASKDKVSNAQRDQVLKSVQGTLISTWNLGKQLIEQISDAVDSLLDRLDSRDEDNSAIFEDFNRFDLDDLSTLPSPS